MDSRQWRVQAIYNKLIGMDQWIDRFSKIFVTNLGQLRYSSLIEDESSSRTTMGR